LSSSSREANKNKKFRTALLSISVSLVLIAAKVVVGILTNSVSILASAADSFLDVTASSVNFYSIRKSEKPADHDHKFGHGKAEGLAGLFQTFIIGSSAIYLIYISVLRLLKGEKLVSVGWGVLVIALSMIVSLFLARHIKRVAEETGSLILGADSLHYRSDLYTNGGIVAGLLVIRFTGFDIIDPIISILVAGFIIWSTKDILMESIDILMDKELPSNIVSEIEGVIMGFNPSVRSYHKLKTRNAGSVKFIEFHVVMDHTLTFVRSHEIAEEIVRAIKAKIENSEVTVHVDPDLR